MHKNNFVFLVGIKKENKLMKFKCYLQRHWDIFSVSAQRNETFLAYLSI